MAFQDIQTIYESVTWNKNRYRISLDTIKVIRDIINSGKNI